MKGSPTLLAAQMDAALTRFRADILVQKFPACAAVLAADRSLIFQLGKIPIHRAFADGFLLQRLCNLLYGQWFIRMLFKIVQQDLSLLCHILWQDDRLLNLRIFANYNSMEQLNCQVP